MRRCFYTPTAVVMLAVLVWPVHVAADEAETSSMLTYYVSVEGNDSWSGRLAQPNSEGTDGPFASLAAASLAARKSGVEQPRRIVLLVGDYYVDKPVILTAKDSNLTIEAGSGASVRLTGGRRVTGWRKDGPRFYSAQLPGVKEGTWDFRALIVNGRYCPRARLPEEGSFEHYSRFDVPWMTTTGGGWKRKPTQEELTTLKYDPNDIGSWLDTNNAEVTVYHMWDESLVGIAALDPNTKTVTFSTPAGHPPGAFGVRKYVVWNVREGMTQPGQWYLDRTAGKLVYWPLPGEDVTAAEVLAPVTESIIRIQGAEGKPARDITIRGLTLTVTTTPLEAGGFGAGKFDGAVSIAQAEDCKLVDLEVLNVGGQGIKASADRLVITGCHVHNTGACGIRFRGTGVRVTDCDVHAVGLTYPSAIALTGGGQGCQIAYNHVHDTPYSAVTFAGKDSRIEHNRIHDAMQELHDGGGIYCFAGNGLVLKGNFIYDIDDTGGYGSSAYYLDERSEDCLVEGNLSVDVGRPSHNHMAKNNTIRNNVFVCSGDARLTFPRCSGYRMEKNIIVAEGKIVIDNCEAVTQLAGNVLFSRAGEVVCNKLDRYSRMGGAPLAPDGGNPQTDPGLLEYRTGTVRVAADWAALKLGIEPVDVSAAGPRRRLPRR